jgi:pimeloyl-ACP methyl ester carboxylesterase
MEIAAAGEKVFAYTGGVPFDPGRPAVVFVHGAAQDHSLWTLQSRWFGRHGHGVLAVDLPGHGRSGGQALTSIEALADWLVALLDGAGVDKAALVGHSMGSLACLEAAARHPQRVRALALVGSAAPMPVSDALLAAARDNPNQAYRMITQWSHHPASLLGGHPVPGMWMPGAAIALMARSRPGVLHDDLAACHAYVGGMEAAARVACPSLLVLGRRDAMTPLKAGLLLGQAIAGARVEEVGNAGHALIAEQPDRVLDVLREFVAT